MAFYLRFDWLNSLRHGRRAAKRGSASPAFRPYSRRPRFEPLEDRRLLAITVNTLIDINANDGLTTLREAIAAAAAGETINFSVTGQINLSATGHLTINKNLTIVGPGASLLTIKAFDPDAGVNGDGARIFNINDGVDASLLDVEISGLTLTGGDTPLNRGGGAIFSRENLRVMDSVISGNRAASSPGTSSGSGGGISQSLGNLFVSNSTIKDNVADESGGGIYALGADVTILDSMISGNVASATSAYGGGIYSQSELTITRSTISGNSAGRGGAGISNRSGSTSITGSTISQNKPTTYGGGFLANSGSTGQTTIVDTIITGNEAEFGGGIYNSNQNLTVTNSTISHNFAGTAGGGIYTPTSVTIAGSLFTGNVADDGGGILSNGDVTITDTTIHLNFALFGAGISHNTGNLTVVSSTFSENDASQGGGILSETTASHKTSILNSTFSDNNASSLGGAILNGFGTVEIRHSTITAPNIQFNSGGGVMTRAISGTQTIVYSSIIANNVGPDVQFFDGATNPFVSLGHNIVGSGNAATGAMNAFIQTGDMVGADPLLSFMLAENGGPTKTHVPRPGSPAIENGPPANTPGLPDFDQRGFPFIRGFNHDGMGGTQLDIGAVEVQTIANLTLVVDTLVDEHDGNYGTGDMSLREAIGLANGSEGANVITIAPSLTSGGPGTILLTLGELQVVDPLTLPGPGAALLTIDASGNDRRPLVDSGEGSRVFNVDSDILPAMSFLFTLSGFTLTGADYQFDGGGIRNQKTLVLNDCVISGNSALNGAGIYVDSGTVTLNNCTVVGNHALESGGGIFIEDGTAIINSSTFHGNTADMNGGGIYNEQIVEVNSSTISSNSAVLGGGIYSATNFIGNRLTTITNSTISGNTAIAGGGIYHHEGLARVRFSTITDNDAPAGMGSGVASHGDSDTRTEVTSTIIAGNEHSDVDYVNGGANSFDSLGHNLVGDGNATQSPLNAFNQTGDQVGANPMLGPLANNGGPTRTHALLAGSPAINTGDMNAIAGTGDVPSFDQRGAPFSRVAGGRIDKGAHEAQPIPPAVFGDYNEDGFVNAADYTVWRNASGQTGVTPYSGADGDGDGVITQNDYQVWKDHYGQSLPPPGAAATADEVEVAAAVAIAAPSTSPPVAQVGDASRSAMSALDFALLPELETISPPRRGNALVDRATPAVFNEDRLLLLAASSTMAERRADSINFDAVDAALADEVGEGEIAESLDMAFGDGRFASGRVAFEV